MDRLTHGITRLVAPDSLFLAPEASSSSGSELYPVAPGDLVLLATPGAFYGAARRLAQQPYDHILMVLRDYSVLHVGPPRIRRLSLAKVLAPERKPLVLRPRIPQDEKNALLRHMENFIGGEYDLVRGYETVLKLGLMKRFGWRMRMNRLRETDLSKSKWICSDILVLNLMAMSHKFKEAVEKHRDKLDYGRLGAASISDFVFLAKNVPELFENIPLPQLELSQRIQSPFLNMVLMFKNMTKIQLAKFISYLWKYVSKVAILVALSQKAKLPWLVRVFLGFRQPLRDPYQNILLFISAFVRLLAFIKRHRRQKCTKAIKSSL